VASFDAVTLPADSHGAAAEVERSVGRKPKVDVALAAKGPDLNLSAVRHPEYLATMTFDCNQKTS
jgi:hypothetical protein